MVLSLAGTLRRRSLKTWRSRSKIYSAVNSVAARSRRGPRYASAVIGRTAASLGLCVRSSVVLTLVERAYAQEPSDDPDSTNGGAGVPYRRDPQVRSPRRIGCGTFCAHWVAVPSRAGAVGRRC